MRRLLRSSAMALVLGFFLPAPGPETIFVYATARAQGYEGYAPTTPQLLPDGTPIPDWIQSTCCGPRDAHKLRADQVHRRDNGRGDSWWEVDGYYGPQNSRNSGELAHIPDAEELSSQDGNYWIFYADYGLGGQSRVYCFFVPMAF